jgi:alpha-L-rhamnosidase
MGGRGDLDGEGNSGEVTVRRLAAVLMMCVLGSSCADESSGASFGQERLSVLELTCEYAVNPLGIDVAQPRFGWTLESSWRGQMQSAYQVLVASSEANLKRNNGDKWDSGKVDSGRSVNIVYQGKPLASREKCWWKVRCWGREGKVGAYSNPATFEMGLLNQEDWQGEWIGAGGPGAGPGYIAGRFGEAVDLAERKECVSIEHYARLRPNAQITISAWIMPAEFGDQWRQIYRKEDGESRQLLAIGKTGNTKGVWFGLGIDGSYTEHGAVVPTVKLEDGKWHLITATYDGSFKRIYFDGSEIGSHAVDGPIDKGGSADAYIGSWDGRNEFFYGGIDDVRIYNRALSAREIQTMARERAGDDPALVGWWKLDGNLENSADGNDGSAVGGSRPAPLLRKEFNVAKKVERARLHISGLGWYELFINGGKVGDNVLDPATTDYHKRILYVTYNVTDRLRKGANAIGVTLGNGWYCEPGHLKYGDSPRLLMQLHIEFADGTTAVVKTDRTWKSSGGPIVQNDISNGEIYDARLEKPGWATAGYDDSEWYHVESRESPGGALESQLMPAIKVMETIKPVKLTNPEPGVYVYDMGQLFGGWARLRVKGPRGTRIAVKYSARLFEDSGLIDKRRHGGYGEIDYYILKGEGLEVYEPRFTYHPVRYVQIEGHPGEPALEDVEGRVIYSAVDTSGDFECSNPLLNQIHKNVVWTLKNGLFGIPLDCLHREHWAWTDPATVTGNLYPRKHMPLFWTKWVNDIADAQHEDGAVPDVAPTYAFNQSDPAWGGNYPILVWYLHQYYGDRRIVEEHYDGMKKWIDYLVSIADGHLITDGHYGDHMMPGDAPGMEEFISSETPPPLIWTGYFYRGALVLSKAAGLLGKTEDAERYARLAESIRSAFNDKWLNENTGMYAAGAQTANIFPLALEIVPEANLAGVLKSVTQSITDEHGGHLHTGNTGTTCMIDKLVELGCGDLMYRVVNQTAYPGWGFMVDQGATTIWESWSLLSRVGDAESMIMWATIDELFYHDLAGIGAPEYYGATDMEPGFRQIHIRPHVLGDLKHAGASVKTVRGIISSSWKRTGDSLALDVTIPVNAEAKVSVPTIGLKNVTITEAGKVIWKGGRFVKGVSGITAGSGTEDYITFDVGSGTYSFLVLQR